MGILSKALKYVYYCCVYWMYLVALFGISLDFVAYGFSHFTLVRLKNILPAYLWECLLVLFILAMIMKLHKIIVLVVMVRTSFLSKRDGTYEPLPDAIIESITNENGPKAFSPKMFYGNYMTHAYALTELVAFGCMIWLLKSSYDVCSVYDRDSIMALMGPLLAVLSSPINSYFLLTLIGTSIKYSSRTL